MLQIFNKFSKVSEFRPFRLILRSEEEVFILVNRRILLRLPREKWVTVDTGFTNVKTCLSYNAL